MVDCHRPLLLPPSPLNAHHLQAVGLEEPRTDKQIDDELEVRPCCPHPGDLHQRFKLILRHPRCAMSLLMMSLLMGLLPGEWSSTYSSALSHAPAGAGEEGRG